MNHFQLAAALLIAITSSACLDSLDLDAPSPEVRLAGEPANLDVAMASMQRLNTRREACIARGLAIDPGMSGYVHFDAHLSGDGRVDGLTITDEHGLPGPVIECVRGAILETIYPAPGSAGTVRREGAGLP